MWQTVFSLANLWALGVWIVLIALPRGPMARAVVLYAGAGLLCLAYAIGLGWLVTHGGGPAGFTLNALAAEFAQPRAMAVGWLHYLSLDLFTGLWIARDADAKGFGRLVQAPVLMLTFLAGPAGLLVWLIVRERRARRQGRPT